MIAKAHFKAGLLDFINSIEKSNYTREFKNGYSILFSDIWYGTVRRDILKTKQILARKIKYFINFIYTASSKEHSLAEIEYVRGELKAACDFFSMLT